MDLTTVSDEQLIKEVARRLQSRRRNEPGLANSVHAGSSLPLTKEAWTGANAARQQMIRSLRAGVRRGQPVEILRFLVMNPAQAQTMTQISANMQAQGYSATRYYDASNALVEVGFAERTLIGNDKAWFATREGRDFLNGIA